MRRFPNHQFAASSAQQYDWLEELYPDVFADVKEMVKEERFIPVGGAWIEHDCILPSGESLCRQYLYGQRYFEEKFGVKCKEAWLPDTFGYASQLPQILRLAGMEYFFTQKVRVEAVVYLSVQEHPGAVRLTRSTVSTALLEQHQRLPALDVQLGSIGWNSSIGSHDSSQLVQLAMQLVRAPRGISWFMLRRDWADCLPRLLTASNWSTV